MNETKYWLWLSMIFGTGSRRIWEAMRIFEKAEDCCNALKSGEFNGRLTDKEIEAVTSTEIDKAVEFIEYCNENNIGIAGYSDDVYPQQLRHILNPPAVIYYRGNINCLNGTRTVTAVGARKACDYSIKAASRVCRELAANGIVIVSGFAVGIDITAHLAAAKSNRPTACVLGCGIDVNYPKENFSFRDVILNNGGVFVSEYPPGTPPHSSHFPMRNRILSALGRVAIVFEASEKSGSLITAGLSLENGRDVFCLPPADIFSDRFMGNIAFLRDGANTLFSYHDVLDCFKIGSPLDKEIRMNAFVKTDIFAVPELHEIRKNNKLSDDKSNKKSKTVKSAVSNEMQKNLQEANKITEEKLEKKILENVILTLEPVQRSIAELLYSKGAMHADELAQKLEMNPSKLMTELTELEIFGIIKSLPGKMYEIN